MKKYYDAVIVGCGVAGCFTALHLPQEADILMITKADTEDSDSFLAQGGICVLKNESDYDAFYEDTMHAGHYENTPESVDIMIFIIGAALMLGMGVRSVLARRRLQTKGEKVTARVAGTAQGRDGQAYVLEFETAGGSHRLHYPKAAKGKGFAAGETVTLYYDPEDPEKMYVEGDRAVLGAEVLYFALAVVLVLLMAGFVR